MTTLQLPEGYTVRKVGNSLKVVPMRRKVVIVKQEEKVMNGTEKQVKWAQDIRKEAIEWAGRNVQILKENGLPEDFAQDLQKKVAALIEEQQEAKYWIDNRKLQMGVPAQYQEEISNALQKQIPPLRTQIHPEKYDLVWQIRGLRRG